MKPGERPPFSFPTPAFAENSRGFMPALNRQPSTTMTKSNAPTAALPPKPATARKPAARQSQAAPKAMEEPAAAGEMPAAAKQTTIFIVDDHPVFVRGIRQILQQEPDFNVCGNAASAPEALSAIERLKPDFLILDVSINGSNGIELMKTIRAHSPGLPVLFLSMHDEDIYAERALRAGARGYVMKARPADDVIAAIRRILAGGLYLSEALGGRLLNSFLGRRGAAPGASPVDQLSDRELEVFRALGEGKGTRAIAEAFNLSVKTVETHRAHIKEKLNIRTATELIRAAVEWVNQESKM
jgi:DNA-binding NarL/FixJ family response regulator